MRTHLAVAVVAMVSAGCGRDERPVQRSEGGAPPEALVLRVSTSGGFLPGRNLLASVPALTVFGDGLLLEPPPGAEGYPGPLVPAVQQARVPLAAVRRVLGAAHERGLLDGPVPYGRDVGVADAETTRVLVGDGERQAVHEAYALQEQGGRLDEDHREARRNLLAFLGEVREALAQRQDVGTYRASVFEVRAGPAADVTGGASDGGRRAVPWPLTGLVPLAAARSCTPVRGEAADELRRALADVDELTVFADAGQEWIVAVRPVLPRGAACG